MVMERIALKTVPETLPLQVVQVLDRETHQIVLALATEVVLEDKEEALERVLVVVLALGMEMVQGEEVALETALVVVVEMGKEVLILVNQNLVKKVQMKYLTGQNKKKRFYFVEPCGLLYLREVTRLKPSTKKEFLLPIQLLQHNVCLDFLDNLPFLGVLPCCGKEAIPFLDSSTLFCLP